MSSVYICLFLWESFSRHSVFISICGKTEKIGLVRNKDAVRYRLNSDSCMTILLHQLWEELLPWERTQWHWSKHVKFSHHKSRLFHKGCLSLHSCQTAILSHVGALNSAYWAFSTFQSALIWAIALVVLSSFSIWKDCDRKGIDFKTQKVEGKNIVGHGLLVQSVVDWIRVELSLSGPAWKHNR